MNSKHNIIVVLPHETESTQALSPEDGILHKDLDFSPHLLEMLKETGWTDESPPQPAHFYKPNVQGRHINRHMFKEIFIDVLAGVQRASLVQVCCYVCAPVSSWHVAQDLLNVSQNLRTASSNRHIPPTAYSSQRIHTVHTVLWPGNVVQLYYCCTFTPPG